MAAKKKLRRITSCWPWVRVRQYRISQVYGKITNWSQLGGADKRIALITRQGKTSGVGLMSRLLIYNDAGYEYKARSIKVKSTGPLEKKVEKMRTSIAVDGISSAKRRNVKVLSINGVKPTKKNIGSGKYILYRPLYLVLNKSKPNPEARKFIDFALSAEGQKIISEQGTVNLEEGKALDGLWKKQKKQFGF
ncbi:MAG TPA: extracellular solute-binding protein [Gammaproteobacteria bacterium]|nr:extracellular solute-binding protein [Gammaproteobacteria bacterium]